jgi:hypothetical protein
VAVSQNAGQQKLALVISRSLELTDELNNARIDANALYCFGSKTLLYSLVMTIAGAYRLTEVVIKQNV